MSENIPGRKTPTKGVRISLEGPNLVFLTVNAKDRVPWMAQGAVQKSLETVWRDADAWLVGYYLLMPDHLHLFCAPRDLRFTIENWMKFWKSEFSRSHLNQDRKWQRSGFHYRLRNADEFTKKWNYVRENPIRKRLVQNPDNWRYSGTIHDLRW